MSSTTCAQIVVEELISFGVREAVLAPGSRNAPLAYELYEADKIGLLRLHVRIDERSAAFTALGLAKASGLPVPVITTSGTAAGNLHPAIMEAWHSRVPLIAITADRPQTMIDTGANQTTRQRGLFAGHVRADVQLAAGDDHPRSWRYGLQRVLVAASGRRSMISGPVHINVAFTEPLVPQAVDRPIEDYRQIQPIAEPIMAEELGSDAQTVIVAGDLPPEVGRLVADRAEQASIPLLAEPSSNARRGPAAIARYRLLLQSSLTDDIERVVVFGHPTLSRPVSLLLQRDDVEVVVVDPSPEWNDAAMNASRVVGDVSFTDTQSEWLARWQAADQAIGAQLLELIVATSADGASITGPGLAAALWARLGADDLLFVGSSNPVRDLDLAAIHDHPPEVYANRGLAGIDGSVSTAAGIALATDRPAHALLGDLTLLHEAGGLIIPTAETQPQLRLVIADDDGGSIFATLEQGQPAQMRAFERVFGVAHGADLAGLATAAGAQYTKITELAELDAVLDRPPTGLELVDVVVDRAHRRTLDQQLTGLAATI